MFLALRIGIDIACRASHRAACADSTGQLLWRNVRFQTRIADLEALWKRIPEGEDDITVVMEPTQGSLKVKQSSVPELVFASPVVPVSPECHGPGRPSLR